MLFVSDVHDSPGALRKLVGIGEEVAILGDLVNLNDYRTGRGAVADVLGSEFAEATADARAKGDYEHMRQLWGEYAERHGTDLRRDIGKAITDQYRAVGESLSGGRGLVIHGNVDRPDELRSVLPEGWAYVHGERVQRDGVTLGFIGGGVVTPLRAAGEISDEEMVAMLGELGPVDVLCTHVPAAVPSMRRDVITGQIERGSEPILQYLRDVQPRLHISGDVHQPQATSWRVGRTRCFNVSYFRATGRYLRLDGDVVMVGGVG